MKKITLLSSISVLLLAACSPAASSSSVINSISTSSSSSVAQPFRGAIKVYTRDTSSGTRAGFFGVIGFSAAEANDAVLAPGFIVAGNQEQVAAAQNDPFMIGYVSLSTLNTRLFKGFDYEGVTPNEANVLNGTYKLARRFNWMLRDSYAAFGADADKFEQLSLAYVAYLDSREGRGIIYQGGGIVDTTLGQNWATVRTSHPICQANNSGLTLKIGGSDSVESLSRRIGPAFAAACGNVVIDYNHTGSSNGYLGTNGNASDPSNNLSIHVGFASREFRPTEPARRIGVMATDAIVAIGHLNNPIKNLTAAQLTAIYKGEITNWEQLG
jgi:phosphate transport system substrate-binding protein